MAAWPTWYGIQAAQLQGLAAIDYHNQRATIFPAFGAGFPDATVWFCFKHTGEVMPEVQENMVKVKLDQVRRKCPLGAMLWLDLMISADNGDLDQCRRLWGKIRDISVEASDLLKSLNSEKGQ